MDKKEIWGVLKTVNKNALRLVAFYSTCLPGLANLCSKHDLTAFFLLKVFCAQLPPNES